MYSAIFQTFKQKPYEQIKLPDATRNYSVVDERKVGFYVNQREKALPQLEKILQKSNDEKEVTETLYIIDRMIDNGVKGVDKMYPALSRFNNSKSPNVQTFLVG